ncbi:ankyrin repeat-containing protein 4 [Elsinoe australis]|uniref:Ankyrin repeat-containing protein 4 n=1 Tax=Elsinoe australis TaxID=40998 RepID=A0A4U7B9K2_9PEZI|nr:ankyrin repeat-containing protein 4 [Elsinoe australis]
MAVQAQPITLPALPAEHTKFIEYVNDNQSTPMAELLEPYKAYDNTMREVFAQQPNHKAISVPNIVPLFSDAGAPGMIKIRPRDISAESDDEKARYLMPLSQADRKTCGSPAVVKSLQDFRRNFNIFSESSLSDMDWSNVICAGSAVATCLLPAPAEYAASKRSMRQYYHEKIAPASDVDLFLYGLSEEQAVEKIKQIEKCVKDSILTETTTIRTKNAITIASQYPTRHIQVVLRLYKSVSEILTGFDVDSSCAAYDGQEVFASPRAIGAFMTQINTIDLSRRSPSYESRLSKYSKRGFEVYWPHLDRQRVDPTIFERNFTRTVGLARLLVLEKLPSRGDRELYQDQRRRERGRPAINRGWNRRLNGNVKDQHEDEVPEWLDEEQESNYHTFTVPYGPKFNARKIERLLYAKDLLLNAEWNRPKDRDTNLHRHPAFFGNVEDVITDCCGYCPQPLTSEDEEICQEEQKVYVSGNVAFLEDDPGRQAIGSFNPITDQDWTEMAYIGNTEQLCQAIVDHDLEHVKAWLKTEGTDPNRRDHTGRTPLQLAVQSSSDGIVQCLIDSGARLIARVADGRTALHIAAMLGRTQAVGMILRKSEQNEEEEAAKKDALKGTNDGGRPTAAGDAASEAESGTDSFEEDIEATDDEDDSENGGTTTDGSYVRVRGKGTEADQNNVPDDDEQDEADIYDVNVTAWDVPVTPLHLAIANGHMETVRLLVQEHGADVLLPVKLLNAHDKTPRGAILPLVIAMQIIDQQAAVQMVELLIELGASAAQADMDQITVLHYAAVLNAPVLRALLRADQAGSHRALRHLAVKGRSYSPIAQGPLSSAIKHSAEDCAQVLLDEGVEPVVSSDAFIESMKSKTFPNGQLSIGKSFRNVVTQPVLLAVDKELPTLAIKLLDAGADANTLTTGAWDALDSNALFARDIGSLLDRVNGKLEQLRKFKIEDVAPVKPLQPKPDDAYLGTIEKQSAIAKLVEEFESLHQKIVGLGGKTIKELHPDIAPKTDDRRDHGYQYNHRTPMPEKPFQPDTSYAISGLTEKRREGYDRLFQACWDNNVEIVKKLTLTVWDEDNSPLQIAVKDAIGLSPFSLAVLLNHRDLAETVMDIAQVQYDSKDDPGNRKMYTLDANDSDDDSCSDGEIDSDDPDIGGIRIYSRLINDTFTIDDIGTVQAQVKSNVSPVSLLTWSGPITKFCDLRLGFSRSESSVEATSDALAAIRLDEASSGRRNTGLPRGYTNGHEAGDLFQLAIHDDDHEMLTWLLDLGQKYTKVMSMISEDSSQIFVFPEHLFLRAITLSRISLLELIIQRTGAGIPLDALVETSGVEVKNEAPKYYQGLSVHGQKRADWVAQAGGMTTRKAIGDSHPPLLEACRAGSLKSVEYFLSDAASRHYREFAEKYNQDKRLQTLAEAKGGLHQALDGWLMTHSHLALHCVVLGKTTPESLQLLSYLIEKMPECLESKSQDGETPLHLAFALHRKSMIELLLKAGADQTARDSKGRNILHVAIERYNGTDDEHAGKLRSVLSLVDRRLFSSLSMERSAIDPGSLTPLAFALKPFFSHRMNYSYSLNTAYSTYTQPKAQKALVAYVRTITTFTSGAELSLVNGAGDTPLHTAVRGSLDVLVEAMLEDHPALLWREDATGRTPFEVATDEYLSDHFADPVVIKGLESGYRYYQAERNIMNKPPEDFVGEQNMRSIKGRMWDVVKGKMMQKRRLCALGEANEVAKRLAEQRRRIDVNYGEQKADAKMDEVAKWVNAAKGAR